MSCHWNHKCSLAIYSYLPDMAEAGTIVHTKLKLRQLLHNKHILHFLYPIYQCCCPVSLHLMAPFPQQYFFIFYWLLCSTFHSKQDVPVFLEWNTYLIWKGCYLHIKNLFPTKLVLFLQLLYTYVWSVTITHKGQNLCKFSRPVSWFQLG